MKHYVKRLDDILLSHFGLRTYPDKGLPDELSACGNVGQEQLRLDLGDSQPLEPEEDHESFYIRQCPFADFDAMCPDSCFEYRCCQFKDSD